MKFEFEQYNSLPCSAKVLKINGINADQDDFGFVSDENPEWAEPYGCGNMQFRLKKPTKEILEKYNITTDEYYEIIETFSKAFDIGCCGWCT